MGKKHKKHHKSEKSSQEDQPIKLVLNLKVPSGTDNEASPSYPPPDGEERHKKHKKKKKKHKHHHDERKEEKKTEKDKEAKREHSETDVDVTEPTEEPPLKKPATDDSSLNRFREPRSCTTGKAVASGTLKACLHFIQRTLQRKDSNGFFSYPVNDIIAPGYSSIISRPMDFSTMQNKIDRDLYETVIEYKRDYKQMCDNAMTYNHPDTIFYKTAQKLLETGLKMMSKDGLLKLKNTLSIISGITESELGLEQDFDDGSYVKPKPPKKKKPVIPVAEVEEEEDEVDDHGAKEILALAEAAAQEAAEELANKRPHSKMGFLRRREDGTTSLNILNPDNDGIVSETERIISIGQMVGKLNSGTGSIAGFKEDKRNRVTPITYLQYGPFGSYGPYYDSSFSNLSKEDSDQLLTTYGSDQAVAYADSLKSYVAEASEYAIKMVDNLLDILTGGEHSKTQVVIKEKKAEQDRKLKELEGQQGNHETEQCETEKSKDININFESVRSLSELGIDMTFVDDMEKEFKQTEQQESIQRKLDSTADLINNLEETQSQRLSQKPTMHLAHIPAPSEQENKLAQKVSSELKDLTKQVTPADVVSVPAVRSAMGITLDDQQSDAAAEISKQLQEIIKNTQEAAPSGDEPMQSS